VQKSPLDCSGGLMFLADFKSQHYAAIFLPPCKSIRTKFPTLANNKKARWIAPVG
jgi:hypothetical protein